MNFERGKDPKVSIGIGKQANPIRIQLITELHREPSGRITAERFSMSEAQKLLINICGASKDEALFNIQDRNIMLVDNHGNARDIKYMWGEWVCLPGFTFKIPEFLKPEGASRI